MTFLEQANSQKLSRFFVCLSWVLVVAMLILIFYISSRTENNLENGIGIIVAIRKLLIAIGTPLFGADWDVSVVGHFGEFFLLGLALSNALRLSFTLKKACILAIAFTSAYGVLDEIHQIFVPTRFADPADWIVDTFAGICATLIFWLIMQLKSRVRSKKDNQSERS